MARDGRKCQMPQCKGTDKRLQCHHIKPWADNFLLRYSINNGITLCRACHDKIKGHEQRYVLLFKKIVRRNNNAQAKI